MEEEQIKITVIIPVYNSEKYLEKCLKSVNNQSYSNWNAIIIDDASTDNSYKIITNFLKRDNRFRIYRHEENQGPGVARNNGIQYASINNIVGDYIVFIDSDDWVDTDYFKNIVEIAKEEEPDIIFVDVIQEDERGNYIKYQKASLYSKEGKNRIIRHQMTGKLPWGGVRKVVKSQLIMEHNISFTEDAIGEEAIYSFRVLNKAEIISFIDKPFYHYVIHKDSQSSYHDDDPYGKIYKKLEKLLKEMNLYETYRETLISFAYTAMIVSIDRITQYYKFNIAIKLSKKALKEFKDTQGYKQLDIDSLDIRTRLLLPFAKMQIAFPIVLASKIKKLIKGNR